MPIAPFTTKREYGKIHFDRYYDIILKRPGA